MGPGTRRLLLVFGGTFDPPTIAHVEQPRHAMRACGADGVLYVPAALSPLKVGRPPSAAEHRLAMLRLALADEAAATISTVELERAADHGPSYTIDTLELLAVQLGPATALRLLIGTDQLRDFHRWKRWTRILEIAEPLVMLRPPDTRRALCQILPDPAWARRFVDVPPLALSATEVRRRVAFGIPIDDLVPAAVCRYIARHGLYREPPPPAAGTLESAR